VVRLLAVVEYDGTDFAGFQLQTRAARPQPRTVQAELERAITAASGATVRVMGSGRTDAGVHAIGQVIHFDAEAPLASDLAHFQRALNAHLAPDVRIHALQAAPAGVHARYSARTRTYRYRILNAPTPSPLWRRFVYHVRRPLDVARMAAATQCLVGTHDFVAFAARESGKVTVRNLYRAEVNAAPLSWPKPDTIWQNQERCLPHEGVAAPMIGAPEARLVGIEVEANAFLRHMMRRIAGTLVRVGLGRLEPEAVATIVASREKRLAGPAVPAAGLCLVRVTYDPQALDKEHAEDEDVFA
jgi:tRNA pseudouridine38-40 synthase